MKLLPLVIMVLLGSALEAVADKRVGVAVPFDYSWRNSAYEDYLERLESVSGMSLKSATTPRLMTIRSEEWIGLKGHWNEFGHESFRFRDELSARAAIISGALTDRKDSLRANVPSSGRRWPRIVKTFYKDGYHFFSGDEEGALAVSFQPVYGFEMIETDDERGKLSRFAGGFRVEAGYDRKLYGFVDFRDHTEAGNEPYDSRSDLYEDRWANVELKGESSTSYNISESMLQYYGKHLSLAGGRGRHKWGPGYFGGLLLNDQSPPFDYARFDATFYYMNYTFLHGFLESLIPEDTLYTNPDGRPRTINAQKYLSAQRLEIRVLDQALFGFSQAVVYGDRGLQLGYLTPLNFLYSVQHSTDDKDNLLLAFDGKWRPVHGLKLYGEFLFDDFRFGDLFTASGGSSKNAYTLGVHGIVPRKFWDHFDARLEYTKIRPFVYSHFFDVNQYSHWMSSLGYTREPNSEFIHFRLGASFFPFYFAAEYSRQNHGANTAEYNAGGSIYDGNYADSDVDFTFLDGQFEHIDRMSLSARFEVLPNLNLYGEAAQVTQSRREDRVEMRMGFGWNL